MKSIQSRGERVFQAADVAVMLLLMLAMAYPLIYTVLASVSDSYQLMSSPGLLYKPLGFSLDAYSMVLKNRSIYTGYTSTLLYVSVGTLINLTMTSMAAYSLALRKLKLRDTIMFLITFTMMFNGGLIPTYLQVKSLGLMNTMWAVVLPVAINTQNLIIMRTAFRAIPESLSESAKIDGAGEFRVFWQIYLPLAKATIAVMVLFYGVSHWNSWFSAAIYLRDRSKYPLQLILREILIQNSTEFMTSGSGVGEDTLAVAESIKYATIVVSTVPILCIYPLLQKYFVHGVMIGAIKG